MVRFGTDGVRGRAYDELTLAQATAIARAVALVLGGSRVVIGRDTRQSGPAFERALAQGLAAEGVEALTLGVVPTPAVAFAAAELGVSGIMISASHNPYHDNGIKVFAPGGRKLSDAQQGELEALLATTKFDGPPPEDVPDLHEVEGLHDRYVDHVQGSIGDRRLDSLHVVVDCANGSASGLVPAAMEALGARVDTLSAEPDGTNINARCGSTYPDALAREVVARGADAGVAFDGDADRLIAVSADGTIVDGDHIIAICARDHRDRGLLTDDTVVVTVMTNLGFRLAMEEQGISVVETPVGDRYVLEALEANSLNLGGEQSGHVIFADLATTGDGFLTAVQLLDAVVRTGRSLGDLSAAAMTRLPQVLENVRHAGGAGDVVARLAPAIAIAESELGHRGRVLVRASGTEPLVRVMVEAETSEQAASVAARLVSEVSRLLTDGKP